MTRLPASYHRKLHKARWGDTWRPMIRCDVCRYRMPMVRAKKTGTVFLRCSTCAAKEGDQ